jgi:Na+-driven multidrug efflux pump
MFLFMPASGLGAAAGVLVGQNLGAGRPDRAERSGWVASLLVEGCFIVFAVVLLLWAEVPVRIFSSDPSVVATAATFLRIATAGYIVMGVATVFQQCISSSGDTILPMVVSFVTAWLVQLPLAYFLPRVGDLGVYGVRWALVIPTVVGAIAYTVYYRRGRWKHKEI